ncbi:hypothetical protein ABK040_012329 [Willaertia magna]
MQRTFSYTNSGNGGGSIPPNINNNNSMMMNGNNNNTNGTIMGQSNFSSSFTNNNTRTSPPNNMNGVGSTSPLMYNMMSSMNTSPTNNLMGNSNISTPSPTATSKTSTNQERIKLYENRKEREKYENLAELYSIIYTVERLEKAYIKDSIKADEYTTTCSKLIAKFKTILPMVTSDIPDMERFMREFKLDCPAATNRLLKVGVPATVEHGGKEATGDSMIKLIAQTTQHFITVMDFIKLNLVAKDQIAPTLLELMDSLNTLTIKDFEGKSKIRDWIITFNQMKAHESLSEEQARQLSYDMEQAYGQFHKALQ